MVVVERFNRPFRGARFRLPGQGEYAVDWSQWPFNPGWDEPKPQDV